MDKTDILKLMDVGRGPLIVDGGLATELESTGCKLQGDPLWSARLLHTNPQAIKDAHYRFLCAGADVITTATYQASVEGFTRHLDITPEQANQLIMSGVTLARETVKQFMADQPPSDRRVPLVAGSVGPYGAFLHNGSEYTGAYAAEMSVEELKAWHRPQVHCLVTAGVDLIAMETIPSVKEAEALVELLREFPDSKAWLAFSCKDGQCISDSSRFSEAVQLASRSSQLVAVGVNCCPPALIKPLLDSARTQRRPDLGWVVYPNSGEEWDTYSGWKKPANRISSIAELSLEWMKQGCALIADLHSTATMAQKLVIIDTDAGIDDAQAIMMALAAPGLQILGITCCFGNTDVDNVCQNVLLVLSVCERTQIPVFQGAAGPLVGATKAFSDHFGTDGLGDVLEDRDPQWKEKLQTEHAVNAMIRLVADNPKQVSLVALGPLTNLALAIRLDPSFQQNLKELIIMGGNMEGKGNVSLCGEFNFVMDPESAFIVLEEYLCPTRIASWEYCCRNKLEWEFFEKLINEDTPAGRLMKTITSKCWGYSKEAMLSKRDVYFGPGFVSYDAYAVAACIDISVVTESIECAVRVELQGELCRGMMVLDQRNRLKKKHHVSVMKTCDLTKFRQLLMASLRQPCRK